MSRKLPTALLFAVAWVACGGRPPAAPPRPVAAPQQVAAAPPPAPRTIADEFITTFWCGPPLHFFDDQRASEIAAAGFNLVGATCEGPVTVQLNNKALRIARRHGLKMLIKDPRFMAAQPLPEGWQAPADNAIRTYRHHESLAGFFLLDEPRDASINADIAALRRRLRREAPGLIGYVNLLPDYVFPGPEDYREHVEAYLFQSRPDLLSYDHYPFLTDRDRPSFFENLLVVRELAIEYQVPFLLIVQLMPHAEYRDVTWPELAWQAFHAVAFGARGISYFAYWTPTQVPDNLAFRFRKGIIEGGVPTEHYGHVARLNHDLRAIAGELSGYTSTGVWDSLGEFGDPLRPPAIGEIDGRLVVGTFTHPDGRSAALVVNRDYRAATRVSLRQPGERPLQVFDAATAAWTSAAQPLDVPPGEGMLIRY